MATPLADVGDLAARYGALTAEQQAIAPALLADASAEFRAEARQTITLVTDDVATLRVQGLRVRLPQRPTRSVASVTLTSGAALPDGVTWEWDGLEHVVLAGAGCSALPGLVEVTYTHGFDDPPDDAVAAVCAMVNRVLGAPTPAEGVVQEQIGAYGFQLQQGAGASRSVRMFASEIRAAHRYRRRAGTLRTG